MTSPVWGLFILLGLCPSSAQFSACGKCCGETMQGVSGENSLACSQAFKGTYGQCCGELNRVFYCCPASAACIGGAKLQRWLCDTTALPSLNNTTVDISDTSSVAWWPFVIGSIALVVLVILCCWFIFIHAPSTTPKEPPAAPAAPDQSSQKRKSMWVLTPAQFRNLTGPKNQPHDIVYTLPALPEVRHITTTNKMLALDDMMRAHLVSDVGEFSSAAPASMVLKTPMKAWQQLEGEIIDTSVAKTASARTSAAAQSTVSGG